MRWRFVLKLNYNSDYYYYSVWTKTSGPADTEKVYRYFASIIHIIILFFFWVFASVIRLDTFVFILFFLLLFVLFCDKPILVKVTTDKCGSLGFTNIPCDFKTSFWIKARLVSHLKIHQKVTSIFFFWTQSHIHLCFDGKRIARVISFFFIKII